MSFLPAVALQTMGGTFTGKDQDASKGIYAMVTTDMFRLLRSAKHRSKDLIVCASFFEIYCGKVCGWVCGGCVVLTH